MTGPRPAIACLGAGRMGRTHARALARYQDARLVAVCDPLRASAEAAASAAMRAVADLTLVS